MLALLADFGGPSLSCQFGRGIRLGLCVLAMIWAIPSFAKAALVSHWKLDDGAPATVASDSVDSNPAAFAPGGNSPSWSTSAKLGSGALSFNGNQWASAADSASLDVSTGITLSAWVKRGRTGTREIFLGKGLGGGPGTNTAYWLEITAANTTDFYLGSPGQDHHASGTTTITDTTTWHHLIGTYDGTRQKLYLDGVLQSNAPTWSGTILNSVSSFSIGRLGDMGGLAILGLIDDVGLWNTALTEGEAKAVYGLGNDSLLSYDLGQAEQLFQLHRSGSGLVKIGEMNWRYATGLGGPLGVPQHSGGFVYLQLDLGGSGLIGVVPEPSTLALLIAGVCGCLAFLAGRPGSAKRDPSSRSAASQAS